MWKFCYNPCLLRVVRAHIGEADTTVSHKVVTQSSSGIQALAE